MAILERELPGKSEPTVTDPHRHPFSREDFHLMATAGILDDQRFELIEGDIIEMAPIGHGHATVLDIVTELLREVFGKKFRFRNQSPIALGEGRKLSEPQPDVAVVAGSWREFAKRAPQASDVRLVIEIAESGLKFDRSVKAPLYAAARIPEYWIVNLVDNCLEVYREPIKGIYASVGTYQPTDQISPLHASGGSVTVGDFLP